MRKSLFFAVALVALAACNKSEVIEVSNGGLIGFRTVVSGSTKAAAEFHNVTTANIAEFKVTAQTSTPTDYFTDVLYTNSGGTFTSANKYYWPSSGVLTFYAYAPVEDGKGLARTGANAWTVAQQETPADQPDFVVAKNTGDKANNAAGVELNFRHAMAKVSLKVLNSNTGMNVEVKNWKVAFLNPEGTFTLGEENTVGNNSSLLDAGDWALTGTAAVDNEVNNGDDLASAVVVSNAAFGTAKAVDGFGSFIVIPQAMTVPASPAKPAYAAASADAAWNSSYIAVKMVIKNNTSAGEEIAEEQWCCWPISTTWVPGKHYTYTIDLADGGYKMVNDGEDAPETTVLDPVLDNAEIKFVDVTVDDWTAADGTYAPVE